jgi:hypothetical protein
VESDNRTVLSGAAVYRDLVGRYLDPPMWLVRYARFEGDVAERAEEYRVSLDENGGIRRFEHRIPEGRAGAALEREAARALALSTLADVYDLDTAALKEVTAEPRRLAGRRDWKFVFRNPTVAISDGGEARLSVSINGDETADMERFVHVPEDWQRRNRDRQTVAELIRTAQTIVTILILVAGGVMAAISWSRRRFATSMFALDFGVIAVMALIQMINGWPSIEARFSTAQSIELQAGLTLARGALWALIFGLVFSLNLGLVHRWFPPQPREKGLGVIATGAALDIVVAGLGALIS